MTSHEHKWAVYSTALVDGCLMLHCACGAEGRVDEPTRGEWSAAFYAPSKAYAWTGGNERVRVCPTKEWRQ